MLNINLIDSSVVEHYIWKNGVNGVQVEHLKIIDGGILYLVVIDQIVNGITNYDINAFSEDLEFFIDIILMDFNCSTEIVENNLEEKRILKVVDLLGREVKEKINTPMFYIFTDGTFKKKISY